MELRDLMDAFDAAEGGDRKPDLTREQKARRLLEAAARIEEEGDFERGDLVECKLEECYIMDWARLGVVMDFIPRVCGWGRCREQSA